MLHVCSIFVWIMIKMQWLPLILNGKSTDKALFCLYEEIYFICVTYLFDLGLVLKFQFSFVIYIYILFKFCHLADAFIQSDLQMRTIEAIKTNKRAIICKCYISILQLYFSFMKKFTAFRPNNNKRTHLIHNFLNIILLKKKVNRIVS